MKLFLAISALVFSINTYAAPAVGDAVYFTGTWGSDSITQHISFTGFDSASQQFTQVTTTTIGSAAPATQTDLVAYNDTASDAALTEIINTCTARSGTPETITVPAGTFRTCKMLLSGNWFWIAEVPFAVARVEATIDGKALVAVLSGVSRGSNP